MTTAARQMTVGEAVQAWLAGNVTLAELADTPRDTWVALRNYVLAIDWAHDRWLWALGAMHAALLLLVVATRRKPRVQLGLLGAFCVAAFCAGRLNDWGRAHWMAFSSQPYFDRSGAFASLVWAGPLAMTGTVAVINLLIHTAQLVVAAKRAQARARARAHPRASQQHVQEQPGSTPVPAAPAAATTTTTTTTTEGAEDKKNV